MPLFCLGLGGVVLLAGWLGGQLESGVYGLVVLAVFGLVLLLLGGRALADVLRGGAAHLGGEVLAADDQQAVEAALDAALGSPARDHAKQVIRATVR